MPGIWQRLGGFGTKVIRSAQALGRSLGETLRLIKPVAPVVEPMAAARDWGRVSTADALEPQIAALRPDESVPRDLYTTSDIPWSDKYAYEVSVYGRNISMGHPRTWGQFTRQKFDMTVSRVMNIQEITEEAHRRHGKTGDSPKMVIFSVAVTGAWKSAEVEW